MLHQLHVEASSESLDANLRLSVGTHDTVSGLDFQVALVSFCVSDRFPFLRIASPILCSEAITVDKKHPVIWTYAWFRRGCTCFFDWCVSFEEACFVHALPSLFFFFTF